jgi:hypothetical protein
MLIVPRPEKPSPQDRPARSEESPRRFSISRWELSAAPALLALIFGVHIVLAFRWKFDPDEWQHLHVAWVWSRGLLAYRDIFDNHAPLFHILTAPFVAAFGETPKILSLMRLVMVPLTLATLACSALISLEIWGIRAALWTPVVLASVPVFFFRSLEYRTDALWAALCTGAVAAMVWGSWGSLRAWMVGTLFGLAIVTSLKSLLVLFCVTVAVVLLPFIAGPVGKGVAARRTLRLLPPLIGGAVAPPALLTLYYAARHSVGPFFYATVTHNLLPGLGTWTAPWRRLLFLPALALIAGAAAWTARRQESTRSARRAAFLILTAGIFVAALHTLWPLYTTYDLLVFYPLAVPVVVGLLQPPAGARAARFLGSALSGAGRYPVISLLLLSYVTLEYAQTKPARFDQEALLSEVLRVTDSSDLVLDEKGDSIYRLRPTYYIMERLTMDRLERGLIPEHIQEDVIASRTCVAAARIGLFPARTRRFLNENFIPVGHLLIAGHILPASDTETPHTGRFDIEIPARYALVAPSGGVAGLLDGKPYTGPRDLAAGSHTFNLRFEGPTAAVAWAKAIEKGFSPFHPEGVRP